MKKFKVHISDNAQKDLDDLYNIIVSEFSAPITAFRYVQGLKDTIKELSETAEIYQIQNRRSLQQYGANVRRVNYKKMAVIYTTHTNVVYIHRIVPQSLIREL